MSGSGGSYVPTAKSNFDCENGVIVTNIASPNSELITELSIGDELEVLFENGIIQIFNADGEFLGSIIHSNLEDLIRCIEAGNTYKANVISIQGNICTVRITRV